MSNPTSNFNWQMPMASDLVTDLPADFETFGQAVDTTLAELKGGTTGQILSKTSNTDMDFTWTTPNPGDITGVTAGTGITGGGTSGDVTVSFDQANFGGGQWAAGKNSVLNSDYSTWQRGTTFTSVSNVGYTADRWCVFTGSISGRDVSRQATNDTTNLPFIKYAARVGRASGNTNTTNFFIGQSYESVNSTKLAGKTVTISYYARAGANYSSASSVLNVYAGWGTGTDQNIFAGFTGQTSLGVSNGTLTTTWQRFTTSGTLGATATQFGLYFGYTPVGTAGANDYFEITGVQVEIGSTATPFQTATGTIQGELAACQRYYEATGQIRWDGYVVTGGYFYEQIVPFKVTKRTTPTVTTTFVSSVNMAGSVSPQGITTDNAFVYCASSATGNGNFVFYTAISAEL